MKQSAYEILNVEVQADRKEIRRAYKTLAREFTPEKHPDKFSIIREAYEYLTQMETSIPSDHFPLYQDFVRKMKTEQAEKSSETLPLDDSIKILNQVFETPFNTVFELNSLFEKMNKEQLKEYINEAVDAMDEGDLEAMFPPRQQPDLYTVVREMVGLRGEVKRLSQSSLQLNNQLKTSAEEQKREWGGIMDSLKTTTGASAAPIISEDETKDLIAKLVEQDDNLQRMYLEFEKMERPTLWTINVFKQQLASWEKGFEINQKQWESFFKQTGIYKTGRVGEKFEPRYHEAIDTKRDDSKSENIILETELVGIIFKDRLIRRARVVVNK